MSVERLRSDYLKAGDASRGVTFLIKPPPTSTYSCSHDFQDSSYEISSSNFKSRLSNVEVTTITVSKLNDYEINERTGNSNEQGTFSNLPSFCSESHMDRYSSMQPAVANGSQPVENPLAHVRRISIWDIIPDDVDAKIAKHIRSSSYSNALMFAKQSARQARAMAEALDNRLVLTDATKEDMNDWISIFGDAIRHLDSSRLRDIQLPQDFGNLPRLKKAEIVGIKSHYNAVKCSPRLKSLRVVLDRDAIWDDLIEVCTTLPLEELCLDCGLNDHCCRQDVSVDQLFCLADACPKVTKLDMKCSCERTKSFWPFVVSLKSLRHLKLYRKVDEEAMDFLRSLKEVEFCEQSIPIRHIFPIAHNITALTQLRRARVDTVQCLENFPRLRKLHLAMVDRAEEALPKVIEKVEVLDLSWGYDDFYDEEEDNDYGDGSMDFDMDVTDMYRPNPNVIEEIVHSAQYLREIHLRRVIVKAELVEKIIKIIGRRLEKLSIHMDQQDEPPAIRLTRILAAVARYSPNIKQLTLLGELMNKHATSREKQDCYRALKVLKGRSPFTATYKIEQFIDGIEEVN